MNSEDSSQHVLILVTLLPLFGIIGAGAFLRRRKLVPAEADSGITRLLIFLLYPCLILNFVMGNPLLRSPADLLTPLSLGFGTVGAGFGLCLLAAPLLGLRERTDRRTFGFTAGLYNYGYLPIPIILSIFPNGGQVVGVLMVYNVGVELAFWSLGVVILTGQFDRRALRRLVNPATVALVAGLALSWLGIDRLAEASVDASAGAFLFAVFARTVGFLAQVTVPLGLLLAGFILGEASLRQVFFGRPWALAAAAGLRLLVLPAVFLGLAVWLPVSPELKRILVVQAAMPAALFPLVLVKHYRGNSGLAAQVILGTTVISVVTIPLWIGFGLQAIGS